jgi:hypothetical protein
VFYFEQLLQTALNGIDSKGIMPAVLQIAGTILILSLLYAVYQAFTSGGDVRLLAVAGAKYLILGLIFLQYGTVFRGINTMFNSVADFIYSQSGIGDVIGTWLNQLGNYVTTNGFSSFWGLVTGSIVGFLTTVLILVGLIILPISYVLFTLFYAMYGTVLYVVGPFVLALLPAKGIGQLARTYAVNLMIFQAWGLIYAIMQVLMTAINLDSMNTVLGSNGILNGFVGSSQMILLGVIGILFSVSIALIPLIASRLVRGDVGSAVMATMSAAYTASQVAAAAAIGAIGGGQAGVAAAVGGGGGAAGGGGGAAQLSSTSAPRGSAGVSQNAPASASVSTQDVGEGSLGGSRAPSPLAGVDAGAEPQPALSHANSPSDAVLASSPISSSQEAIPQPAGAGSASVPNVAAANGSSGSSSSPRVGQPGQFHGFDYTHAASWGTAYVAGWALGKTMKLIGAR